MPEYCNFCGTKIREDGFFCEGCGRQLISEQDKKKKIDSEFEKKITEKIEKKVRLEMEQILRKDIESESKKCYEKKIKILKLNLVIFIEVTCLLIILLIGKFLNVF